MIPSNRSKGADRYAPVRSAQIYIPIPKKCGLCQKRHGLHLDAPGGPGGAGYFEVRRNEKLPFFVKTKDLQLQVLGTKFNFRDYPEDHEVVVSLLEGKVELNNLLKKEKEAILAPDERAILNKTNGRMTVETVTVSNASQWTDGYLFFDEELLPDIVKELERSYNVTIRIANDSLNTFRFYGNFVRQEQSIQEVLDALASTEKIQYKIEERNITIY